MRLLLLALPLTLACSPGVQIGTGPDPIDPVGGESPDEAASWIPGRYLVRFAPGFHTLEAVRANPDLAQALDEVGASGVTAVAPGSGASFLQRTFAFDSGQPAQQVLDRLHLSEDVVIAEPAVRVEALDVPNDPLFERQWHMGEVGVPEVWDASTGEGTVVAVLDTGVSPGLDGFAHLLPGKDTVNGDEGPTDGHGHGTHVAGTIAQATGNDYGVAGVAPDASILPVKVLSDGGYGSSESVAEGIVWAADNGAHIINMSLGASSSSRVIEDACRYAAEQGVLIVAAAGNDGYSDFVSYPAAYPTVIAVGATDMARDRAYYSNRGDAVELAAPGGDTTVDSDGDGYVDGVLQETTYGGETGFHYFMGTSMATPHVAGAAALVHAAGITDAETLRAVLAETAVDLGDEGRDTSFGFGLVDPVAALEIPDDPDDPPAPCPADLCLGDLAPGDLAVTEVMADPSACPDRDGEWIEVANRTQSTVDLDGLRIVDSAANEGRLDGELILEPGDHAALGRGSAEDWCGAFTPAGFYGSQPALNNGGDRAVLMAGDTALAESLAWEDAVAGTSWELEPDDGTWHLAETPIGDTDELGSPGSPRSASAGAVGVEELAWGDLWITEIMANPARGADATHEWIEVLNTTDAPVDLQGLTVDDNDDEEGAGHVATSVVVAPGEVAVLARGDGSQWLYGFTPDAFYGEAPALGNGGDDVVLIGSETLDEVFYFPEEAVSGVSLEWVDGAYVLATTPIGDDGDFGTPGELR